MDSIPQVIIITGSNRAGKITFVREFPRRMC